MDKTRTRTNVVQLSNKRKVEIDEKLKLDDAAKPRVRTRSAMAIEMAGGEKEKEEDVFHLAAYHKRGIALIIDTLFLLCCAIVVKMVVPWERMFLQLFLDKYHLKFILSEMVIMQILLALTGIFVVFTCMVIPLSFFNVSFGKKLLGLRVRGISSYSISIGQAIKRELIMKPISILIVAGFVTPFFSKRKSSVHDFICDTVVIEE